MGKNHIKRLTSPKRWEVLRKEGKWITRPRPGTHRISQSLSLNTILKEFLKLTKTTKETKHVLNGGKVKINGVVRKDNKFAAGLMDVITIEDIGANYRLIYNEKGRLSLFPIKKPEAGIKPEKIIGKKSLKKNKLQINLGHGRNILETKKDYNVNDTLVFDLNTGKVKDHLKLEKGAIIYITKGNKVGKVGIIKSIDKKTDLGPSKILFISGKGEFETLKDYALVIGKTKPIIALPE